MSHPVPIEKKKVLGNPGGRAMPNPIATSAQPVSEPPVAPKRLQGVGATMWGLLWTYAAQWLHPQTDLAAVARYCEYYQMREELTNTLDAEGMTTLGSQGQTVSHPSFADLLKLDSAITTLEGKLGLTPADRARIGLAVLTMAEKKSGIEAFQTAANGISNGDSWGDL